MPVATLLSILFFFTFAIYLMAGVYTLLLNARGRINHVFFLLCLSLAIWAVSFAFANGADSLAEATRWRRFAAVGFGLMHSLLLYFVIHLTERTDLLRRRWITPAIFAPALVNLFAFALHGGPDSPVYRYQLIRAEGGWINLSNNGWDLFFNIYFLLFALISGFLLFQWGSGTEQPHKRRIVRALLVAFAVAIVLGGLTDVVLNVHTGIRVPPLAPILTLLPLLVLFATMMRYGVMHPESVQTTSPDRIFNLGRMERFSRMVALLFAFGSAVQFALPYFSGSQPLREVLPFSISMLLYAVLFLLLPKIQTKNGRQDFALTLLLASITPLLTWLFQRQGNQAVWFAPIFFLMLAIIFSRKWMIVVVGISVIGTRLWIWYKYPYYEIRVDGGIHFMILVLHLVSLGFAFYVNRIYLKRLEENAEQLRFQELVSRISARLVTAGEMDLQEHIQEVLALCGTQYGVDRAALILVREQTRAHVWQRDPTLPDNLTALAVPRQLTWLREQLGNQEVLNIPDVDLLPEEARMDRQWMRENRMRAMLVNRVESEGIFAGYLTFISDQEPRHWRPEHVDLIRIVGNLLSDAMAKADAQKEINTLAYYDPLTHLPNRLLGQNRLEQAVRTAKREGRKVAMLFLDLDAFKTVNDTMGHAGGDELLKQVAARLSACVRTPDMVSRFGGDEFMVLVHDADTAQDAAAVAGRMLGELAQPVIVRDREFFVTGSIGIALYPEDGEDVELLIRNADMAMYAAKEAGKNRYSFCSETLKQDVLQQTRLTNDLYRALERGELRLVYQPQVRTGSGVLEGFEALLRWHHPEMGIISPGLFIPLAESTGLIHSIGQWVLREACRQHRVWQNAGLPPIRMAVTLSMEQFRNPNLVGMVAAEIEASGIDPKWLELEITESIAANEAEGTVDVMHALRALGVQIAIDDFGTEYSSLSRLKSLPVDRLKLDMMFVHGIGQDPRDEAVARTILRLAADLSLHTLAEGVETAEQEAFLLLNGCEEIQGYFYHRPMPPEDATGLLAAMGSDPARG
jgi:diguanylate cyclase (GGDEF)-like protein